MYDKWSPMPGREPEMPARLEWTLTTMPQPLAWGRVVIYHGDRITTILGRLGQ